MRLLKSEEQGTSKLGGGWLASAGPHDADAAIPEHAEVPCTSHLGRIDQDDFDGWDEFFFDGE